MLNDIEIAEKAKLRKISEVAKDRLGISEDEIEAYGRYKAKVSLSCLDKLKNKKDGKLILVTAISPTPAGEGKTTTTVGLGDALNLIGKKTMICLREPSLGPVFGMKGGATGGGYAQIVPMEDINLHFTGDFAAIAAAHNLLAAMLDNHIYHGNELGIDTKTIQLKRTVDMNDRAIRKITLALNEKKEGFPREGGFDIIAASEIMAIFCLSTSIEDLKKRIGQIVVAYNNNGKPVLAKELKADGAMTVLLKDALAPNLVQTLENNPAFVHGGPFANIAHGCNSVLATKTALKLADYVVTEAGFGADLGAEKFIDIKCRKSGIHPSATVLVATVRAIKYHGGAELSNLTQEDISALDKGLVNLERHVENMTKVFNLPCVVAINKFTSDTPAEIELILQRMKKLNVKTILSSHWSDGSKGAVDLAKTVVELCENSNQKMQYAYEENDTLIEKINKIAKKIYRASEVTMDDKVKAQIENLQKTGYGHFPICVAKTQSSFSIDPKLRGAPSNHSIAIREIRLSAGAEFIVIICGSIMTMPGLPKVPSAEKINYVNGKIIGLS
ncbi:MAG: formate--tetrahydrofolate ligase [Proteobacteria bacterium]|nr:formate--tetrahydrofolate ligase [Candidatus Fonsibacter sp. PEL4]